MPKMSASTHQACGSARTASQLCGSRPAAKPPECTPSEVLLALEYGYRSLKLFPANGSTSVKMLKSFKGPFTGIRFCPTGGVTPDNLLGFLRLPNVACVGGTWIAPSNL